MTLDTVLPAWAFWGVIGLCLLAVAGAVWLLVWQNREHRAIMAMRGKGE